jgi:AcrR family transcriptional regulator
VVATTSLAEKMALTETDEDPRIARSRARIRRAATELLIEGGPRAVTVDAVSERSGVAKSTLYRHWSSVNELLLDVLRANVPDPEPIDLARGFEAALRTWVRQAVTTLSAPDWSRILPVLLELRTTSPEMAELLDADFDEKLATVVSILDLGVAEGRVPRGVDPRLVTMALGGPLALAALTGDADHLAALADFVVDRFLASYPTPSTGDPHA